MLRKWICFVALISFFFAHIVVASHFHHDDCLAGQTQCAYCTLASQLSGTDIPPTSAIILPEFETPVYRIPVTVAILKDIFVHPYQSRAPPVC